MRKRFLSILMVLSLALSMLPTVAFAVDGEGENPIQSVDSPNVTESAITMQHDGVEDGYASIAAAIEAVADYSSSANSKLFFTKA